MPSRLLDMGGRKWQRWHTVNLAQQFRARTWEWNILIYTTSLLWANYFVMFCCFFFPHYRKYRNYRTLLLSYIPNKTELYTICNVYFQPFPLLLHINSKIGTATYMCLCILIVFLFSISILSLHIIILIFKNMLIYFSFSYFLISKLFLMLFGIAIKSMLTYNQSLITYMMNSL